MLQVIGQAQGKRDVGTLNISGRLRSRQHVTDLQARKVYLCFV